MKKHFFIPSRNRLFLEMVGWTNRHNEIYGSTVGQWRFENTNSFIYFFQFFFKKVFFWIWIPEGRLEFIGGGWAMHDEATVHYSALIDNMVCFFILCFHWFFSWNWIQKENSSIILAFTKTIITLSSQFPSLCSTKYRKFWSFLAELFIEHTNFEIGRIRVNLISTTYTYNK